MRVECTEFNSPKVVETCLEKLRQGEEVEVHGAGKYVSTVALAITQLKSDYSEVCSVTSMVNPPYDDEERGFLTVKLQPVKGISQTESMTTPEKQTSGMTEVVEANPVVQKKRAARARSFTTLRNDPNRGDGSPCSSPIPRSRSASPEQPPRLLPTSDEPLTAEELRRSYTPPPNEEDEDVDFHSLFYSCCITGKRPAQRYFPRSKKSFCLIEAQKHFNSNPVEKVAICYELGDEAAWDYQHNRFATYEETEHFAAILDPLFRTKGGFMQEAVTDKHIEHQQSSKLSCTSITMQGWRSSNEDSHNVSIPLPSHPSVNHFGVYDGHGGWKVADFVGNHLHNNIDIHLKDADLSSPDSIATALTKAFLNTDEVIQQTLSTEHNGSTGTTVNSIVICDSLVVIANSGDSRAVMSRNGIADRLSNDHKPDSPRERTRILNSGSRVCGEGRVEGMLAVSRALGDFDFKQAGGLGPDGQAVTCCPAIEYRQLTPEDNFIVQACDGIWDCMSDQEVVDFLSAALKTTSPKEACSLLLDHCISPTIEENGEGTDNMTVNLIIFNT